MMDFARFFTTATEHAGGPFPYQERLADTRSEEIPDTLILPTGSGRTEAAVLSLWLWKIYNKEPGIPRRLVYCLPSGALTGHTAIKVKKWLWNLRLNKEVDVRFLAGGSEGYTSGIDLERPCVMIGTQEVLLSGALNHMYGQRPGVWPVVSALLNNDSMWVMDEARTMGAGLGTSLQLDAFRRTWGTFGPSKSVWISTVEGPETLGTPDNPVKNRVVLRPGKDDLSGELGRRYSAAKMLRRIDLPTRDGNYTGTDVGRLLDLRKGGSMAIIVNTIERAQRLYTLVRERLAGQAWCILVHPRFRAYDGSRLSRELFGMDEDADGVIISTQALETGADLSVRTVVTELAPWPSMVRRIGRCNGKEAAAYWIDLDVESYRPYTREGSVHDAMGRSREALESMEGRAVSASLLGERGPPTDVIEGAITREELEALFDTTPDIAGSPVDVSRFTGVEPEALVFWSEEERRPRWNELCGMDLGDLREFVLQHRGMCTFWDLRIMKWREVGGDDVYPGMIARIESAAGGYTNELGLCTGHAGPAREVPPQPRLDRWGGRDVTLREHTQNVVDAAVRILSGLGVDAEYSRAVRRAAQWHDVGKLHRIFQEFLKPNVASKLDEVWAKSGLKERDKEREGRRTYTRRGFRHEVASALAFMDGHDGQEHDLVAYLVMSHHGIVRVVLRGPWDEPADAGTVAGIMHGEPICDRGYAVHENVIIPAGMVLDTSISDAGERRPWRDRTSSLLKKYGPFRLAYLETILRKADWAASAKEDGR